MAAATLLFSAISCNSVNHPPTAVQATVLEVEGNGRIFAHHTAFNGMPAMTMEFAVPATPRLKPGDAIEADVDTSKGPWVMTNVKLHTPTVLHTRAQVPLITVGDRLPDLPLHDQNGSVRQWADFAGHPFALSFIYTRCQDPRMCPATTAKFVQAAHIFVHSHARFVEVTLDPEHDTPRVLHAYQNRHGIDPKMTVLLVSQPRQTKAFAARLGILERPVPGAILHTERVVIVDSRGHVRAFLNDISWRAMDVVAALKAAR